MQAEGIQTRYLSPPFFMQFKTYHYYPVKIADAKKLVEPHSDNRIYCGQL